MISIATGPARIRTHSRTATRVKLDALWSERGLAVHTTHNGSGYTITHLASGYAVVQNIRGHRKAIALATRLLDAGDWTRSRTSLTTDARFKDRVFDIRAQSRLLGLA